MMADRWMGPAVRLLSWLRHYEGQPTSEDVRTVAAALRAAERRGAERMQRAALRVVVRLANGGDPAKRLALDCGDAVDALDLDAVLAGDADG